MTEVDLFGFKFGKDDNNNFKGKKIVKYIYGMTDILQALNIDKDSTTSVYFDTRLQQLEVTVKED